jgi:hypothetical protein
MLTLRLVNTTLSWPDNFRRKLKFSLHDIWYPEVDHEFSILAKFVVYYVKYQASTCCTTTI